MDNENIKVGKKIVLGIIITTLLFDFILISTLTILYLMNGDTTYAINTVVEGLIRFSLEVLIMYFLYKGHRWAKWLMVVLCGFGVLIAVIFSLGMINMLMIFIGVLYLIMFILLVFSKDANAFLRYKRSLASAK